MNSPHKVGAAVVVALVAALLLVGLLPQRYIPQQLAPVVSLKGEFFGQPIRVKTPGSRKAEVSGRIWIKMNRGICRASLNTGTVSKTLFSAGTCNTRTQVPAGSELVLDPQGNTGSYKIILGPEWHALGPKTRRLIFLPMSVTMVVALVAGRRFKPSAGTIQPKRVYYLVALAIVSGAVLYPAVHEFGHLLFGMLLGAEPDWSRVVWTPLGGEEPHAAFTHLPKGAGPLMSAGGALLPTFVALVLLAVWKLLHKRISWHLSAALVSLPALWLLSTLGCLFELYGHSHMDALAVHLGLAGPLRVLFSLSPLLVAILVYVWLGMEYRRTKQRAKPPMSA